MSTVISSLTRKPSQEVSKKLTKTLNKLRGKPTKTNADKKKIKNLINKIYGSSKLEKKKARLIEGAGDLVEPSPGKFREGQKLRRSGGKQAKDDMSLKEKGKLLQKKEARKKLDIIKNKPKQSIAKAIDFDYLKPKAKRAERKKFREGKSTPYADVIRKRIKPTPKRPSKLTDKEVREQAMADAEKAAGIKKSDWDTTSTKVKPKVKKTKTKPKPKQSKGKKAIKELDSILEGYKKTKQKYSDIIDFKTGGSLIKKKDGSLVGGQKKLDVNRDGKITGSDFEMLKMNKKKYGGKISYRMKGGQVVDSSYD